MKKECKYSCFDHFLKTWTYFFASNEVQRSNPDYKHTMSRLISRNVLLLSLISLCTDLASELLYPVMPGYLRSIGFSMALIGLLEGIAEAVAGLSKGYFGHLSDVKGRRLPFVQWGYALSAISKPLFAITVRPVGVFFARTIDRVGKGIRTGARDALLSADASVATKARVFGFHRAMDTIGAVLGPLVALLYLSYHPGAYRHLFLLAFLPGFGAIVLTMFLRERRTQNQAKTVSPVRFLDFTRYWRIADPAYRKLVAALLVFALVNSSDIFLLLRMRESGMSDPAVIGAYCFYNLIYALAAYPLGMVADRFGFRNVLVMGLFLFAGVYAGFAVSSSIEIYMILLAFYGIYAAATESVAKAWITTVCEKKDTATAVGTFAAFQSVATLLSSTLTGILWTVFGPFVAFGTSAIVTILVACYMLSMKSQSISKSH